VVGQNDSLGITCLSEMEEKAHNESGLTSSSTGVTNTSHSVLIKLLFTLNTLDRSSIYPNSLFCSPFLQLVKAEQFYPDGVGPVGKHSSFRFGEGVDRDDDS